MISSEEGPCPPYIVRGGKVTDLKNLILADYNSCIHVGHDVYPNRLGFLDRQVVSTCSAWFTEQFRDPRGPFWRIGPPRLARPMWSHEGIRVYTPIVLLYVFSIELYTIIDLCHTTVCTYKPIDLHLDPPRYKDHGI
jgi:hypothetical protein